MPKYTAKRCRACQEKRESCSVGSKAALELCARACAWQDGRWCIQFRITFCWTYTASPENRDNNKKWIRNAIPLQLLMKNKNEPFFFWKSVFFMVEFLFNTGFGKIEHWGKPCCFLVYRLNCPRTAVPHSAHRSASLGRNAALGLLYTTFE